MMDRYLKKRKWYSKWGMIPPRVDSTQKRCMFTAGLEAIGEGYGEVR